jgi:hypothetical protein
MDNIKKGREAYPCFDVLGETNHGQDVLIAMSVLLMHLAEHLIVKQNRMFEPIMQLASNDKIATCELGSLFNDRVADMRGEIIATFLAHAEADFYVIASEAWTVSRAKTEGFDPDEYQHGDLARAPDKVSCFSLSGESISNDVMYGCWEIEELGHERRIDFNKPLHLMSFNRVAKNEFTSMGALTDLLAVRRAMLHEGKDVH